MSIDQPTLLTNEMPARDFYLARQPILNRAQGLFAYELLFRTAAHGPANVTNDSLATATVMANTAELGMHTVVGNALAFVNVDMASLASDFVRFLPHDRVVFEILETVQVTPELIARVTQLARLGFRFALDDVIASLDDLQQLLPVIDIIKVDIHAISSQKLASLATELRLSGKKLLAEKVETLEEFEQCVALGFDYFQGYYFAKPLVMSGKKLSPSQLAIVRLMTLIQRDANSAEIETAIKQDVSIGLNLLRLVNSPGAGVVHRIDSISQAVTILGRLQLQRWLTVLLYSEPRRGTGVLSPLLVLATTRGKLLELISLAHHPADRLGAERAFTVGIMSLMDTLISLPMTSILDQILVSDEIRGALLERAGHYGRMLTLVQSLESDEDAPPWVLELLHEFDLTAETLCQLQLNAYAWSNAIASDV